MGPHKAACVSLAAVLVLTVGSVAAAQTGDVPADQPPPIVVSVDCESTPERVRITNATARPLRLRSVGSLHQRRAGEPYRIRKVVRPGKSVTYSFGRGGPARRHLTGSHIFDNESPQEGVVVRTNRGNVRVRCVDGTNASPEPEPEPLIEAPSESADPLDPIDPLGSIDSLDPITALTMLASLPVEPEFEAGYARALFEHWIDADGDGCDTRREVLIAESLTPTVMGPGCTIERGTWFSALDGDTLTNPASVDINHVVPLKEAWASGAHAWTSERRREFANDLSMPRTLQAVSAGVNRQQGQRDPASWLPAEVDAACTFVTDWVAIKTRWGLSVDESELDAIELTLERCSDRVITSPPG